MPCGGSIGDGYGPLLVAREPLTPSDIGGRTVAVPGTLTTAYLALQLFAPGGGDARRAVRPDPRRGARGPGRRGPDHPRGPAHLRRPGPAQGRWTSAPGGRSETGLPLPLGGNAVRRDLGPGADGAAHARSCARPCATRSPTARRRSAYAMSFARGMDPRVADRFVGMWVNEMTLDCGERGRRAVQELLDRGHAAGVIPRRACASSSWPRDVALSSPPPHPFPRLSPARPGRRASGRSRRPGRAAGAVRSSATATARPRA